MKYKIISYEETLKIVNAKVTEDRFDVETARIIPVSIVGIQTIEDLESSLFEAYRRNLGPQQTAEFSPIIEDFVQENINAVFNFPDVSPLTVQAATSDSIFDPSSSTTEIQVL